MAARNDERKVKALNSSKNADKIGYVPRNKQASSLQASGLTSAGMMGKGRNDPDQVYTCNATIGKKGTYSVSLLNYFEANFL